MDTERGALMVRQGKGAKDRLLPLGDRACAWVDKYLREVRPELIASQDDYTLFLDDTGHPFDPGRLGDQVRRHLSKSGVQHAGSCHLFRVACATHMLENGADIRFIQSLLGHAKLDTTQIYTLVSLAKLKEVHNATHPAKLTRVFWSGAARSLGCWPPPTRWAWRLRAQAAPVGGPSAPRGGSLPPRRWVWLLASVVLVRHGSLTHRRAAQQPHGAGAPRQRLRKECSCYTFSSCLRTFHLGYRPIRCINANEPPLKPGCPCAVRTGMHGLLCARARRTECASRKFFT